MLFFAVGTQHSHEHDNRDQPCRARNHHLAGASSGAAPCRHPPPVAVWFRRRGDAEPGSDVDLVVELDPDARIGLFALGALERRLAGLIGRPVDLLPEPVEKPRLRAKIDRDRRRAF